MTTPAKEKFGSRAWYCVDCLASCPSSLVLCPSSLVLCRLPRIVFLIPRSVSITSHCVPRPSYCVDASLVLCRCVSRIVSSTSHCVPRTSYCVDASLVLCRLAPRFSNCHSPDAHYFPTLLFHGIHHGNATFHRGTELPSTRHTAPSTHTHLC